jgi:hypothetical protein
MPNDLSRLSSARFNRRQGKEVFVDAALVLASIILSLLAAEVGLRLYKVGWEQHFAKGAWEYQFTNFRRDQSLKLPLFDLDIELGWVPKPGVLGPTLNILKNGIRSNASAEVLDANRAILAVGDSYTFGDQVSDSETWPAQLEKLARRRVINGGVSGYGIDQAFLRVRRLLGQYQISTVIFSFIPNDIERCQMSRRWYVNKPYFKLAGGRLNLENVPVPAPAPRPQAGALLNVLEHSLLADAVIKRLYPKWWLGIGEVQVLDKKAGVDVSCALLHGLEELTKSYGSELIVLIQHIEGEGSAEQIEVEGALSCLSDPATRVLDLRRAFSQMKAEDPLGYSRLFYSRGRHMTPEGNHFVALELNKLLTQ